MRIYIGLFGKKVHCDGWLGCIYWAKSQLGDGVGVVKIHVARPNVKKMRVVAEVTPNGVRLIQNGRQVPLRAIRGRYG